MCDYYQLYFKVKDYFEFSADYVVNYGMLINSLRYQLWSEKLGKTFQIEYPKVTKVRITGKCCIDGSKTA